MRSAGGERLEPTAAKANGALTVTGANGANGANGAAGTNGATTEVGVVSANGTTTANGANGATTVTGANKRKTHMHSYLSLVPISARARRRQTRMTVVCIGIAVFLVTAIFAMADTMIAQETAQLIAEHGQEEVQAFLQRPSVRSLYPAAIFLFLLVLVAGVMMISGSMNATIAQRTKQFGMMRCIGMSKKQVARMVRLEALNWCKTAIPVGVLAGLAAEWILAAVLKYLVGGEFADFPQFHVSIIGIVAGAVTGIITVLLAAKGPARAASRVSPVVAASGAADAGAEGKSPTRIGTCPVDVAMGRHHAFASPKNMLLMSGSLALSIVLLLSFSVLVDLVDHLMPQLSSAADIEITDKDAQNSIDGNLPQELAVLSGVDQVYGRRCLFEVPCTISAESANSAPANVASQSVSGEAEGRGAAAGAGEPISLPVDIISFNDFDLACLEKDGMLEKRCDLDQVMAGQGGLVIADTPVAKGSAISVSGTVLECAGMLKYDPFSADGSTEGHTTIIVSDELFPQMTDVNGYSLVQIQLLPGATDQDVAHIQAVFENSLDAVACAGSAAGADAGADGVGGGGPFANEKIAFNDLRADDTHSTYLAFIISLYGFLAVIALVAVINIVNSLSLRVLSRIGLYGAMRAVGMEKRQLVRMVVAEAGSYGAVGCGGGLVIGLLLSRWLYGYLVTSHFPYAVWSLPWWQLGVVVVFVAAAIVAGVIVPTRRIRRLSIVEAISQL